MNDPSLAGLSDKKKKLAIETKKRQEKLAVEDRISHLERFENEEKNHELNVVFPALEDFVGPTKDRQKTDKRWLYPLGVLVLIFLAHGFSGKLYFLFSSFWNGSSTKTLLWIRF